MTPRPCAHCHSSDVAVEFGRLLADFHRAGVDLRVGAPGTRSPHCWEATVRGESYAGFGETSLEALRDLAGQLEPLASLVASSPDAEARRAIL